MPKKSSKKRKFTVEKIIGINLIDKKIKDKIFNVKWKGYLEPTMEPYENLKNNIQLHKFLLQNNMDYLIPSYFLSSTKKILINENEKIFEEVIDILSRKLKINN